MIGRIEPDCLLAQRFFTTPSVRTDLDVFKCDFQFPQSADAMERFFSYPVGYQFCKGVERLLTRLKAIGDEKHINMPTLNDFYHNLNHRHANPNYHFPYTSVSYQLLTEGIKMLNAIVILLESGKITEDLKEHVLKTLGSELYACAPGCYIEIQGAYLKLVKNPDVVLLGIKTEIAQQVAQELIVEHNRNAREFIYEGNYKHYIAGILDQTANEFGFEPSQDLYVPRVSELENFIQPFRERFSAQLKGQMLITRIVDKLNVVELIQKIKASPEKVTEYSDNFKNELDQYGTDEAFNIRSLFDADKLINLEYELSNDAENYLIISILVRLTKSGFINSESASCRESIQPHIELCYFPFHPLTFSFIIDSQAKERKPFITYCLEYFKENNVLPAVLENPVHIAELNAAVARAIEHDDVFRLSPISLETDDEKLHYYSIINAVPYSKFLAKMLNMMPDHVVSSFLCHIDEVHKRSGFATSNQYNLIVQSYFVMNRYFFTSQSDLLALISLIESFQDLCHVLYFIAENERYHFLLLMGNKLSAMFTNEIGNLYSFLSFFKENERYQLIQYLHFSANVMAKLDLTVLINMLNLITPDHYVEVIHFMLGTERFMQLIPDIDSYMLVLMSLPVNARIHFAMATPVNHFGRLFQDNITNLGKVMAQLPVPDQMTILLHWYPSGYKTLFSSFELLQGYLQPMQPESRHAFLCALPADLLQEWTANPDTLIKLLRLIPAQQHQSLLSHAQQSHTSVITSVTSYLGSLFAPAAQHSLSTEQRENARMHRYDHR